MLSPMVVPLLTFYGLFLITSGVVSVLLIGPKAKTALASGGLAGSLSLLLAWMVTANFAGAMAAGMALPFALFGVFAWRSAKTLFKLFDMLHTEAPPDERNKKGTAFLIISLMAVVSLCVFAVQIIQYGGR